MAMIELVDFNEVYNNEKADVKKTTRRSRSRKKEDDTAPAEAAKDQSTENIGEETPDSAPKAKAKKTVKTDDEKNSKPKKGADE